jgi:hypothetical protein
MPTNPDILKLVREGAATVNPTSAAAQATTNATTSAIQSLKDGLGVAGATTSSNNSYDQNTLRGKQQAAINELSNPRTQMFPPEVKQMISEREKLKASYTKELAEINAGNTSSLDGFVSPGIGVGQTETYQSQARKTYLEGRITDLDSEIADYRAVDNGNPTIRTSAFAQADANLYADQIKDRERSAAGVENLADQLGTFQAHTDQLLGDSVNLSGLGAAQQAANLVAGAERNCGDLLGAVGSLTGGTDIINGALSALGDLGALLEDVNSVLISVNQTKAQLEGLINSDQLQAETILQGAKDAMQAAVLSEINRDPCAAFLFNDVLGTPDLKKLL